MKYIFIFLLLILICVYIIVASAIMLMWDFNFTWSFGRFKKTWKMLDLSFDINDHIPLYKSLWI